MKKLLSILLSAYLAAALPFSVMAEGYGDNNINVDDNLATEYITSDTLSIRGGYIVLSTSSTVGNIISKLNDSDKISAYGKDGTALPNDAIAISGSSFKYIDGGIILETAELVYSGDVNGDGNVDVTDIVAVRSFVIKADGNGAQLAASDIDFDGKITVYDVVLLRAKLLGTV